MRKPLFFVLFFALAQGLSACSDAWGQIRPEATPRPTPPPRRTLAPSQASGLVLHLDAATECDGVADGTAISQWDDLSGNAAHAVQATGVDQPTCQTGVGDTVNGHGVVRFDSSDQLLTPDVDTGPYTLLVVASVAEGSVWKGVEHKEEDDLEVYPEGGTIELVLADVHVDVAGSPNSGRGCVGSIAVEDDTHSTWRLTTTSYDASHASHVIRIGGKGNAAVESRCFSSALSGVTTDPVTIGGFDGNGFSDSADVAAIVLYDNALSAENRSAVERYLRARYAVVGVQGRLTAENVSSSTLDFVVPQGTSIPTGITGEVVVFVQESTSTTTVGNCASGSRPVQSLVTVDPGGSDTQVMEVIITTEVAGVAPGTRLGGLVQLAPCGTTNEYVKYRAFTIQ